MAASLAAQQQEQLAMSRERTEQDLRCILSNKDAELVRMRAEITRMRHAFSQSDGLLQSQASEVQELRAQLQRAKLSSTTAERQALLASATPAASTAQGEVFRLQSELEAASSLNMRLEADLAARAASAAARLTDLQGTYTAKIADMRRLHQEQLAAVELAARQRQADNASVVALQAELAAVKQLLVSKEGEGAALEARLGQDQQALAHAQQQLKELHARLQASSEEAGRMAAAKAAAEARTASLEQQQQQQQQQQQAQGSGGGGGHAADDGAMASMLSLMEGQLARLSDTIRGKDAEVAALRHAVTAGLEERRELAQQLRAQEALAAAAAAASLGGGAGPGAAGKGAASAAGPAAAAHHHSLNSPSKPYRSGLLSKPKFR